MEKYKVSINAFKKMLTESAGKSDTPVSGFFELTPLCNLNCKMCYVHLQDPSVKERMLSGKQWISLIQGAIDAGMMTALLTGGEAMTHPDFWDIYMYLINHGVAVVVKTNGILLTKENIERFKEYPPLHIDVSLYGCNSESYVAVTGVDAFQVVSENIRNAIDAGFNIQLMITPSSYLSPWIEETLKLAKSFDVSVSVNSTLNEPNENTGRHKEDFDITTEEYLHILDMKDDIFLPEYSKEEKEIFGESERPHVSEKGLYCNAGRTGFAISWDGIMVPCISFPRSVISADVVKDGFGKAWLDINSGVNNYAVPKKCYTCSYHEKCHYCPVQHGKMAEKNLCDDRECKSKQNLIELAAKRRKGEGK